MHHPWREFRGLTEWVLSWQPLPRGVKGETDWTTRTVTLDPDLTHGERRSTICHELQHIHRGPVPAWAEDREETIVEQLAARQLIGIHDLGEALAWSDCPWQVADELQVDYDLLWCRLRHLHPSERHYLARRLQVETCPSEETA